LSFYWLRLFYRLRFRGLFDNRFRLLNWLGYNRFWCFLSLDYGSFFLLLIFIIIVVLLVIIFVISW
jgi:hypothetical protein